MNTDEDSNAILYLREYLLSPRSYLSLIVKAFQYALERHAGQLRKDNSTPYIVHPFRVFMFLADKARISDENVLAFLA